MPFEKGKTGNPGGRPNPARQDLEVLLGRVWTPVKRRKSLEHLVTLTTDVDPDVAIRATTLLLAYTYGKPTERKEVSGEISTVGLTLEEWRAQSAARLAQAEAALAAVEEEPETDA